VNCSSVRLAEAADYRKLVADSDLDFPGSIFYHPQMLSIAAELQNLCYEPKVILADDKIIGLINILSRKKLNICSASNPHLFQYFGPVVFNAPADTDSAVASYLKKSYDVCVFSLTPEHSQGFKQPGWEIIPRLTYYLKPANFDDMKSRCTGSVKNKLNRAVNENVSVKLAESFPWDIYNHSFSRKNIVPPLPQKIICEWVEKLTSLGLCRTYLAVCEGKPVAFRTQLVYNSFAYDWLAGAIYEYSKFGVNQYLVLQIGAEFYEENITHWDLSGGDIESIRQFKQSFGAVEKKHLQVERCFSLKGHIYRKLMKLKAGNG